MKYLIIFVCLFMVSCFNKDHCTEKVVKLFPDASIKTLPDVHFNQKANYYFVDDSVYSCLEVVNPIINKYNFEEIQKGRE